MDKIVLDIADAKMAFVTTKMGVVIVKLDGQGNFAKVHVPMVHLDKIVKKNVIVKMEHVIPFLENATVLMISLDLCK